VEQLESGQSFNNRIYFIKLSPSTSNDHPSSQSQTPRWEEAVLKVSGKFFGRDKVQNEVVCLLLQEKYCPSVPAPRVLAWADDGDTIRRVIRSASAEADGISTDIAIPNVPLAPEGSGRGWILMTRRSGRTLRHDDLQKKRGDDLMRQLAQFMAQWRQQLPQTVSIGNLKLEQSDTSLRFDGVYASVFNAALRTHVDGLLLCDYVPPGPIASRLDYYRVKLIDQLRKLETEALFTANRAELSPLIQRFMQDSLPNLSLFYRSIIDDFTFTHYDFSPRNILVSEDDPPYVTGVLDFAFAGFFPGEEEFMNNAIANAGDWSVASFDIFLTELENLGVKTPLSGMDKDAWQEACKLVQIIGDIAPWHLREGGVQGEELEAELNEGAQRIRQNVAFLTRTHKVIKHFKQDITLRR